MAFLGTMRSLRHEMQTKTRFFFSLQCHGDVRNLCVTLTGLGNKSCEILLMSCAIREKIKGNIIQTV